MSFARIFVGWIAMALGMLELQPACAQLDNAAQHPSELSEQPDHLIEILAQHERKIKTLRARFTIQGAGGSEDLGPDYADMSWVHVTGDVVADLEARYWKTDLVMPMERPVDPNKPPRSWHLILSHTPDGFQKFGEFELSQPNSPDKREMTNLTGHIHDSGDLQSRLADSIPTRFLLPSLWLSYQEGTTPASQLVAKGMKTGRVSVQEQHALVGGVPTIAVTVEIPPILDVELFLDHRRGFNIIQANIRVLGPDDSLFAQVHDVVLDEFAPDIWVPIAATYSMQPDGSGGLAIHKQFRMDYTMINEPIEPTQFLIAFPPGTSIRDESNGRKLSVTLPDEAIPSPTEDIRAAFPKDIGATTFLGRYGRRYVVPAMVVAAALAWTVGRWAVRRYARTKRLP